MSLFIKGMDISSYPEMLDKQYTYYDFNGKEVNLLDFAKEQGFNYGRLRIWNEPERVPESGGYCNLKDTLKMAKEIMQRGMGLLLDFHYSDWWADPGNQNLPFAWKELSEDELVEVVYDYTKKVMMALAENGTYPDMVQIGNEIRCGMMWPVGAITNWKGLAKLINAGIKAVRDTQGERDTKIVIHLDQGGRYYYYEEWFDAALAHGVTDFDIIGLSYYPFWHGTFNDLKNTMEKLIVRYKKPLVLAEIAHAYRMSQGNLFGEAQERIAGFPANPEAQRTVLELIMSIVAHVSNDMGIGVFYWEPFWQAKENDGSWGSCMVLVDSNGMPTEGCKAFGIEPKNTDINKIAKIYEPKAAMLSDKEQLERYLPQNIKVLMWDGSIENRVVNWELSDMSASEEFSVHGVLSSGEGVQMQIRIDSNAQNLLGNGEFVEDLRFWEVETSHDVQQEIRQEIAEEFPFEAKNYFYFSCKENLTLCMKQCIEQVETGSYVLSLEYLGDNTTGVKVWLYAKSGEKEYMADIFPTDSEWVRQELVFEVEDVSAVEVGIKVDSPAMYGQVRAVKLVKR
ncbi:MAG: glycosyl hydrolase 53 family protein [Lachnospiraceae bacterium]|nr:glycosyl hydrolase 53 family protein [Lachnospiraceae bacterium]